MSLRSLVAFCLSAGLVLAATPARAGTISVGSMTVNGLKVKNLKCQLKGGGFMAGMVVVSGLAKQKRALQGCANKKEIALTAWKFAAGKLKNAKVKKASSKKVGKCVKKALAKVKAGNLVGTCSAGIVIGE